MVADRTATLSRFRVGLGADLRTFLREPLHLVLLPVLPPVVIETYGRAMASFPRMPFMETLPATLGRINGALFAAAVLAGVVGLFQAISAGRADRRLAVCGYSRTTLFLARVTLTVVIGLVGAGIGLAALARAVTIEAPVLAFGALATAVVSYGLIGMVIGAVSSRPLEGSLVLVFVADVDDALASGMLDAETPITEFLPLHYPHRLFTAAVTEGGMPTADALAAGGYALVLFAVTALVYLLTTDPGGAS